jgi:HK97 gp10 family phage protein
MPLTANRRRRGKNGGIQSTQIQGLDELLAQLENLKTDNIAKHIVGGVEEAAKKVADTIRNEAPQGPTGNLKRAVQYGVYKKRQGKSISAWVRMSVKHKKNATGIAPHAHLVEFGARGGKMPANPFFSRGWKMARGGAEDKVSSTIQSAIYQAIS